MRGAYAPRAAALLGALCACGPQVLSIGDPPGATAPAAELLAVQSSEGVERFLLDIPSSWRFPRPLSEDGTIQLSALVYPGALADHHLSPGPAGAPEQLGAPRSDYLAYELVIEGGQASPWRQRPQASEALAAYRLRVRARALASGSGEYHMCAIDDGRRLYCWGDNSYGQLGALPAAVPRPTAVGGLPEVQRASLGLRHTCVLLGDGRVACFGGNQQAQLGRPGLEISDPTPGEVPQAAGAVALDAAGNQTCTLDARGEVLCWGSFFDLYPSPPARVAFPAAVEAMSAGTYGVCGLVAGEVYCGGILDAFGYPATPCAAVPGMPVAPQPIALPRPAIAVGLGDVTACALLDTGELYCWGCNQWGELGTGQVSSAGAPPSRLLSGVRRFGLGRWFGCAELEDGSSRCWGQNDTGQLGAGLPIALQPYPPAAVRFAEGGAHALSTHWSFGCALLPSETISCWGQDDRGQLGDGRMEHAALPVAVEL